MDSSGPNTEPVRPSPEVTAQNVGLGRHRLIRALTFIEAELTRPLLVEEVAAEVHMSPFHFTRMFKIATGHSPHRYMVIQRIERAKTLLATSNMTIGQVANAVGFRTQAHFTGVFRQIAGTTPGNFRRMQGAPTPMVAAFVTRAESTAR